MKDVNVRWRIFEDGNCVILEVDFCDNYAAIEFSEILARGISEGRIELEFDPPVGVNGQ